MSKDTKKLLRFSAEYLFYEIGMFYEVTFRLHAWKGDSITRHALVEAFVTHAVIILNFMFNKKEQDDDAISNDYVTDVVAWQQQWCAYTEKLAFISQKRNKEFARLSYERLVVDPSQKGWNFVAIAREVSDLVDLFIDRADNDVLHPNVVALRGHYRSSVLWRSMPSFDSLPLLKDGQ